MPITASSRNPGRSLDGDFREERQVEAQETVGAHLQQHARQDHRAGGGRFNVRIRQPGVERPHGHLDGKGGGEGQEQPQLCRRRKVLAVGDQVGQVEGAGLQAHVEDRQQHQHRAGHGEDEELDRRIDAPLTAPHADQEVHRDQGEFPEDEEQHQVGGQENAQHARFEQQEEEHKALHPLLDGIPGGEDRNAG